MGWQRQRKEESRQAIVAAEAVKSTGAQEKSHRFSGRTLFSTATQGPAGGWSNLAGLFLPLAEEAMAKKSELEVVLLHCKISLEF
jgi:hypothetical protein